MALQPLLFQQRRSVSLHSRTNAHPSLMPFISYLWVRLRSTPTRQSLTNLLSTSTLESTRTWLNIHGMWLTLDQGHPSSRLRKIWVVNWCQVRTFCARTYVPARYDPSLREGNPLLIYHQHQLPGRPRSSSTGYLALMMSILIRHGISE